MSDAALPENLDEWPRDPFALLGVSPTISQRELKRTYTRLIRQYKPERMPEQFRRIREAYEVLLRFAAWNDARNLEAETAPETQADLPDLDRAASPGEKNTPQPGAREPTASSAEDRAQESPDHGPGSILAETSERAWHLAMEGKLELAYQTLLKLRDKHSGKPALYARLYWLLLAQRDLDPVQTPVSWLLEGLARCSQYGPLLDLCTEELTDDPQQALSPGFTALLERAGGSLLVELLERRWDALARLDRWDLASVDLASFRERVCREDEAAWLRLALSLASKSFWAHPRDTDSVVRLCEGHFNELAHLGLTHGDMFDRAELLGQLAREAVEGRLIAWNRGKFAKSLPASPETVLRIVQLFLAGRIDELSEAVEPLLAAVCDQPREGLRVLDVLASLTPFTLMEFGRVVDWLQWNHAKRERPVHSSEVEEWLGRRLIGELEGDFPSIRLHILQFCCAESFAPESLCPLLEDPDIALAHIARKISSDISLRMTFRLDRLGWSM
jgi:hypothetical protein